MKIVIGYKTKTGWKGAINVFKTESYNQIAHLIWEELKMMSLKDFLKKRVNNKHWFTDRYYYGCYWCKRQVNFLFNRKEKSFNICQRKVMQQVNLLQSEPKWEIDKYIE